MGTFPQAEVLEGSRSVLESSQMCLNIGKNLSDMLLKFSRQ